MSDEQGAQSAPEQQPDADGGKPPEQQETASPTFTQDDVNKLVAKARAEERRKATEKFGDYDKVVDGKVTAEQRLVDLEQRYAAAEAKALRSDVAAQFGISAEDRDLFLTGSDEETLRAQAERLATHIANRERAASVARGEGANPNPPALGTDEAFAAAIAEALNRAR